MRDWIGRLVSLAAIAGVGALVTGVILGPVFAALFLFAYLVIAMALSLAARARLARWLANPSVDEMPDDEGAWGDIHARLHRILRQQTTSRASLSHALWRFRQAGEAMPDGVIVLDAANRIEWMNPSAERHFGLTFKDDRGRAITNLIRQPAFGGYLDAQHYGEPLALKGSGESDRVLSVQLVPYGDHEKLLLSRDVSRWERLESVRRDFIANVSHELRTPLTVMKGFLETLSDARDADEKLFRRSLELMTDQAERMQRLVEDLLMLSRLEDSRYPLREEPIDMPALVQSVLVEAESINRGEHRIASRLDPQWLLASREEVRSAVTNLVTNAIRYTPAGGDITVTWGLEEGDPVLRVRDNGEGIAPEHIPRLTERFYRVDRSRSRSSGGTGLGLAIVKHVLARHQGQLDIASEAGKGSAFTCRFPASRLAPASADLASVTPIRAA
ncbi:MAG: phosphate regulon sensor histidine kinase PhoR [Betaproteobacteria bacterium]|nr:phosphate regulon sensor histidine kinase PhoR [Betaproteobacteria bacterium]